MIGVASVMLDPHAASHTVITRHSAATDFVIRGIHRSRGEGILMPGAQSLRLLVDLLRAIRDIRRSIYGFPHAKRRSSKIATDDADFAENVGTTLVESGRCLHQSQ